MALSMKQSLGLKAASSRRSTVVVRAGKYDEELIVTAVSIKFGLGCEITAYLCSCMGQRACRSGAPASGAVCPQSCSPDVLPNSSPQHPA